MDEKIQEIMSELDPSTMFLEECGNGIYLTPYERDILTKYHINFQKMSTLKEILFEIERVFCLHSNCNDLDEVSREIAERDYYMNHYH